MEKSTPKKHTLTSLFSGMLRKQGYDVSEYDEIDALHFGNFALKGAIMFIKNTKRHKVSWRMNSGYELFDVPAFVPTGAVVSSEFKNVGDLLNFLQRRLIWKKQK